LGSVIGIAISQVIFTNGLQKYIKPLGLSEELIQSIRSSVEVVKTLPADVKQEVIVAYVRVSRIKQVKDLSISTWQLIVLAALLPIK
jgi:hypothetical protein